MVICQTIRKCHVSTFHEYNGIQISVGVFIRDEHRFVTLCIQDPLLGCQHILTRGDGAHLLIEKTARVLRLAYGG